MSVAARAIAIDDRSQPVDERAEIGDVRIRDRDETRAGGERRERKVRVAVGDRAGQEQEAEWSRAEGAAAEQRARVNDFVRLTAVEESAKISRER